MVNTLLLFAQEYLLKFGFLLLNGVYIVFLIILLQQARAMKNVIDPGLVSSLIIYFAFVNIIIGILIFVAALVIL